MVNKTPLRLVAIEETPPPEEDREGAPVRVIPEHEAITRRVEAAAAIAAHDAAPEKPKRRAPTWHAIVPAAAVVVVLGAVAIGLLSKGGKTATPTATKPAPVVQPATPKPVEVVPPSPAVAAVPAAAPAAVPAVAKAAAETIRLQITAEPVEAVLSLDGNTLAGHRLNLEVPKDRGIHVVSASAPGYLPINQQVSFSGDVVLTISLRRSHTPTVARQSARSQRAAAEPKAKAPARAPSLEPSRPSPEPGMHLDGPAVRANAKPIDERNPYAP